MRTPRAQPRNRDRRPAAACRPYDPSGRRSSCPNGRADCLQYAVSSAARHSKAVANCSSLSRPNCRRRSATSARSAAISALRDAINSSTSAGRTIPPLIHSLVPPSPTIRISMPFPKHCGIPDSPRLGSYRRAGMRRDLRPPADADPLRGRVNEITQFASRPRNSCPMTKTPCHSISVSHRKGAVHDVPVIP